MDCRYRRLEKMGAGGFAEVYLAARHDDPDKVCAVKVVKPNTSPAYLRHALSCTRDMCLSGIALSLNHRNVIQYLEFVVDESCLCATAAIHPVSIPLYGPDLFEWLSTRRDVASSDMSVGPWISEHDAARIAKQVASGLAYIHGWNPYIVHRDVKPENLRWVSQHPE